MIAFANSKVSHHLLCSFLLCLCVVAVAFGQAPVKVDAGNGGGNSIQGDIFLPSGQRFDRQIEVRLMTPRGDISTTTNGNGSFVFRSLVAGRYEVRVNPGDPYAPAYELVDVPEAGGGGRMGGTFSVQVHLRVRPGAPINPPGVVSANQPPKDAVDLYNKALASVKDGHRDKAIEQLQAALKIDPTFVAAVNGLGVQYLKMNKYQEAFEAFSNGLKLTPGSFILHLNCGMSLFYLGKFSEAELQLRAALQKNEASGPAHLYRARALIGLNHLDEAAVDLKRAIEIGGDDVKTAHRYLAGIYMEKGDPAEAVKQLELYLKAVPDAKEADQIRNLIKDLHKKLEKKN
jgi:Tfp pilus assembly protein PilF